MARKAKNTGNPTLVKAKIAFLILLIAGGMLAYYLVRNRYAGVPESQRHVSLPNTADIAGQVQGVFNTAQLDTLGKKAGEAQEYLINAAHETFEKKASEAGSVATDYLFDSAVKPIVQQIEKLPENQQIKLREYVCGGN